MTSANPSATADREIVLDRVFEAPRELVFRAWTEREQVEQWWGPQGFRTTTHEMDVRVGGIWRFIMHGPDGVDYDNVIKYIEIVPPERLVYEHGDEGEPSQFSTVVTFAEENGKTRVTMASLFPTAEARDHVVQEFQAIEGGKQHLERLGEYLAALQK